MDFETAFLANQILSYRLNTCMTKVAQLEEMCYDDDQSELVQELQTSLKGINQEKDILINYIEQEIKKIPVFEMAEV